MEKRMFQQQFELFLIIQTIVYLLLVSTLSLKPDSSTWITNEYLDSLEDYPDYPKIIEALVSGESGSEIPSGISSRRTPLLIILIIILIDDCYYLIL